MISELEQRAIDFTIGKKGAGGLEGGFANDKDDHGGPTFSGFTLNTLRRLSAQIHGHDFDKDKDGDIDVDDLKKLDYDDLVAMADTYWNSLLDQIRHEVVAIKTFDFGFNMGQKSGIILLQKATNFASHKAVLNVDGKLGPMTITAVNTCDGNDLLNCLIEEAKDHYQDIVNADPTQLKWLRGWRIRANKLP